jgi:hypothetical protein
VKPARQLEESLSWRLITELWRRFPDRYALIETHPGGGQYDCLSLIEFSDGLHSVLDVNRGGGSVHVHCGRNPQSWTDWSDRMLTDSCDFLDEIGGAIGLESPKLLPKSTPTTIAFRFVCEFLTHAVGRLEPWECRNGFCDTSGYGSGRRESWFNCFPGIVPEHSPKGLVDCQLESDFGYWFILKRDEPVICLDTDGRLYKLGGETLNLMASYGKHKRIWPVIVETALELLP